jgi:hypothetical protein
MALLAFSSLCVAAGGPRAALADPPPALPLSELVPGTRATARTVLSGTAIESFELEIVSVMHDVGPEQNLILARAIGERLEQVGVSQGMSGSPVYVDGRIVGAVSATWPFTKEPYLGITPVEQMAEEALQSFSSRAPERGSTPSPGPQGTSPPFAPDLLTAPPPQAQAGQAFRSIGAPLILSGFDRRVAALAAELFEPWGFTVAEGGAAGAGQSGGAIEPGATIGVRLAGGDANMTALGTVTWVDGERVHAWGHPFFQMGEVEMPLVSGYIHAVIPSRLISFKLGSGAEVVGTATGDRRSGIFGTLGVPPRLTSFDLKVVRSGGTEEFHYELVRNRFLVPGLVGLTAANSILVRGGMVADETVRFRQRLLLEDGRETSVETTMAGDQTLRQIVRLLSDATRAIATNPFEEVSLDRIEAEIVFDEGIRIGELTEVAIDDDRPEPGDVLRGFYTIRDYRGGESRHRFSIPIPPGAREGRYLLLVSDARTAEQYEGEREPRAFAPRTLDEYLERIRRIRQTDEVHVHLYRSSSGVLIGGRPLADLPASVMSIFGGASRSGIEENLPAELVHEERVPAGKFVHGAHTILLEVRKEKR